MACHLAAHVHAVEWRITGTHVELIGPCMAPKSADVLCGSRSLAPIDWCRATNAV
jgi:hypothetical protein